MREPSSLELDLFSDTDMPVLAPSVEALPEVPTLTAPAIEAAPVAVVPEAVQHLPNDPAQTSKTDVTDSEVPAPTTNAAFLTAIFQGLDDALRPAVTGFPGAPADAPSKVWGGKPWQQGTNTDTPYLNWYFTLAAYASTDAERFSRTEKHCRVIYGVMLDDLGTKAAPLSRLKECPPSIVIETSEGNYQATYLFDVPQTDLEAVKALNESMVDAGLCDPGAKTPPTRWGRLPFAVNGKHDPEFHCKLIEWHPERRYTIAAIVDGLELEPPKPKHAPSRKSKPKEGLAAAIDRNAEGVYTPRPDENEVVAALKKRGLYKSPLGSGKHDVTCPWVHEHTDQIDGGSAYFEPSDSYPIGGFKCQHSHGGKYRIGALLEFLAVSFQAAKHKPTIKTNAGELHRIVDAAEQVLADSGRYYQRGGLIVCVNTDPETKGTTIKPVSQPALVRALSAGANWERYDGRTSEYITADPPARHVQVLFDAEGYNHLAPLAGIARQPHLRTDGSIVREAGYDAATALFGVFDARAFNVPAKPTQAQASAALAELRALLSEFAFAGANDEAAAIAAILTAAIRPALPMAPMFHVKAPQVASGKSYLCSIIAAFATPAPPAAFGFPTNEEECLKSLLATLMAAPGVVAFDNLTTDIIPFKSLCSALTEEFLEGRILGVSKNAKVGTRTLILSSGNNVGPVADMTRRCVTIGLNPQVETPAARTFAADPQTTVRNDRARFVSLALTIVRAWIEAGSPRMASPFNGFTQWSAWVREPLLWLGMPDPVAICFEQMAQDPDREILARLLAAWRAVRSNTPTMIREAVARAAGAITEDEKTLREAMLEVADERGEVNRRRLGRWIARHQNRIVDGLRFVRAEGSTSAERWIAQSVTAVLEVPVRPTANVVAPVSAGIEVL